MQHTEFGVKIQDGKMLDTQACQTIVGIHRLLLNLRLNGIYLISSCDYTLVSES